jgi:hypothetical protein
LWEPKKFGKDLGKFSFFLEGGVNSKKKLLENEKKSPNFPNHKIGGKTYGMWGNKKRYIHTYIHT